LASGNDIVNFEARNGVYHSRVSSCVGCTFVMDVIALQLHDVLRPFSIDDMLYVGRPTDDMSLSYADVICQLAMVKDGVMAFTDSHFFTVEACSFIDFLCTV